MTKSGVERAAVQRSISFSPNVSVAAQGGVQYLTPPVLGFSSTSCQLNDLTNSNKWNLIVQ